MSDDALVTSLSALRDEVRSLPFPPASADLRRQAALAMDPPSQALLATARRILGDPASLWDSRELQALALAPYDEGLRDAMRLRLEQRWEGMAEVLTQLRGAGGVDDVIDTDAATLHALALGAGLAILDDALPRTVNEAAWLGLTARIVESLAAAELPDVEANCDRYQWRARIEVRNSPVAVAKVLRVLALSHVQVISLFTHQQEDEQSQLVDMFLSAPVETRRDTIEQVLISVATRVIVARGTAVDAVDIATRVLYLAARLVDDPASAPQAAAQLVLANSWEVTSATEGEDISPYVMRLMWTPERHVILRREQAPFTRTERERASALLALVQSAAEARGIDEGIGWTELDAIGGPTQMRLARPGDAEEVAAMHARCSEATLFERYFAPVSAWREEQLRRLTGGHRGATLVVVDASGSIIGLGNVFPDRPGDADTAEVALIIDDAHQGAGLGSRLLDHLIEMSRRLGFARVTAYVLADNHRMQHVLGATGLDWQRRVDPELGQSVVRLDASLG